MAGVAAGQPAGAGGLLVPQVGSRDGNNHLIHLLFIRQDLEECLELIEETLQATANRCEYALYVKALIKRNQGEVQESLALFQQAACLNPHNVATLKQVARSLYLLGKQAAALEVYDEVGRLGGTEDWEVWHHKGLCCLYLKQYDKAADYLRQANAIQQHDATFMQLGRVYTLQEDYKTAIEVYQEALEFSPENPEVLTTLGLLYLRMGENIRAFDHLNSSLIQDPKNPKTILAAGSIIQDHSDMDTALMKYRVAAVATPGSAQLWNNIGMCFFGKQRYIAAIACLKKALYLDPFEWIVSYNLGLVHLHTGQFASAFHFLSTSINLKPDFASSYHYLAVTLVKLGDVENACSAYEKALEMESDHVFELNFAITLYNHGDVEAAHHHFREFQKTFDLLNGEARNSDPEVLEISKAVEKILAGQE